MVEVLLVFGASVASAQSFDCVPVFSVSQWHENGACVAHSARIDRDSSIGADARVERQVWVGPNVAIGERAVLARRARVIGRPENRPWLPERPIGADSILGRSSFVGDSHVIGQHTIWARGVRAGERFDSRDHVVAGFQVVFGDDVAVGSHALVGAFVEVGDATHIAPGTVIGRGTTIADSDQPARIAGRIGAYVSIGSDVHISPGVRIQRYAIIGDGVTLHEGVRIGRGAQIGAGAVVDEGVRIGAGAVVPPRAWVAAGTRIPRAQDHVAVNRPPFSGVWSARRALTESGVTELTCLEQVTATDWESGEDLQVTIEWERDGEVYVPIAPSEADNDTVFTSSDALEAWRCRASVSDGENAVWSAWSPAVHLNPESIAGQTDVISLGLDLAMTFCGIDGGTFEMGCKPGRDDGVFGREDCTEPLPGVHDGPVHDVTLTHNLWCADTEVTQAQFVAKPRISIRCCMCPTRRTTSERSTRCLLFA